eukprot:1541565-Pyramimonas_sp.AAC.1
MPTRHAARPKQLLGPQSCLMLFSFRSTGGVPSLAHPISSLPLNVASSPATVSPFRMPHPA